MNAHLAKGALDYLKSQGVRRVNLLPGEGEPQQLLDEKTYDKFLFCLVRHVAKGDMKALRQNVLGVLRGSAPPADKRAQIQALIPKDFLARSEGTEFGAWFERDAHGKSIPLPPRSGSASGYYEDERRIRFARKALKFGYGNCMEQSAIVATWLLENSVNVPIHWMKCHPYDHAYVLLGNVDFSEIFDEQPDDVFIVDGWSDDFYPAKYGSDEDEEGDPRPPYGSPSGLQLNVRKKILDESLSRKNRCERVRLRAPAFAPGFCLARAREPSPKGPAGRNYPEGVTAADAGRAEETMSGYPS
jgi:hypothetical protein